MATVRITITDLPGGKLTVKCEPNLATMALKISEIDGLSPAESIAMLTLRTVRDKVKEAEKVERRGLIIP